MFLTNNRLQSTDTDDLENNNLDNTILDSERLLDSERFDLLIIQLRHHYDDLVKIFRTIRDFMLPPISVYMSENDGVWYPKALVTQFGRPSYCD